MTMHKQIPDFLKNTGRARFAGKRLWLAMALLALLVIAWVMFGSNSPKRGRFLTEETTRGNLLVTISASGTLQPTRSVDVGSELSGTLEAVFVEENDRVRRGQILARLDTAKLQDAVVKSRATVNQMSATVAETRASLGRLRQVAELSGGKVPSKTELETAQAALQRAVANEKIAQATLKTDETNIRKAIIRSPIDGVILTRKVEPGQTVVAAMTIPVLFVLAEDLTKMDLQVKVDESDVGAVQFGQPAHFTVSAWPDREFPATIQRVGMGSTVTDNVVTYKTVLSVANKDMALRPGMTATARIVTAQRQNALLVPNAALRFVPTTGSESAGQGSFISRLLPRPPQPQKNTVKTTQKGTQVWVLHDEQAVAIPVRTGVSNGRYTEVLSGDLKEGMAVIVDYQEAKNDR
jgi:HlyD family secretion protein